MRTLCTIFLLLALLAPGTVIAGSGERPAASIWSNLFGWIAESIESVLDMDSALPNHGGGFDPYGSPSTTLPDIGGGIDPFGSPSTTLPDHGGTLDPYGQPPSGDPAEDEPSVPNMGGTTDPYG